MPKSNLPGIYAIVNLANGKMTTYVGSTGNAIGLRWTEHRTKLRSNKHFNRYLQSSWNKHGESAFRFEALENVLESGWLPEREQFWLDEIRSHRPVYNTGKCAANPLLDKPMSDATKKKLSEARLSFSDDVKKRLAAMVSKVHKGKEISNAQREFMHFRMLGNNNHPPAKPYPAFVNQVTGKVIPSGMGLRTMCRQQNLNQAAMWRVMKGICKQHLGWEVLK